MDPILELAKMSFEWNEEDQYSFIWGQSVVFVKADRDSGHTVVISYHPPEVKEELYLFIHGKLNPWIRENLIADEESGD